jgi:hypothetical protein
MKNNTYNIKKKEGIKFAKFTGDNNGIHINEEIGNNSIYGENIIHGVLIILKSLEVIKFKKKYTYIKVFFEEGFKYNHKITLQKSKFAKSKILYNLIQQNNINAKAEIGFFPQSYQVNKLEKESLKKKYLASNKKNKDFTFKSIPVDLVEALSKLTKYVGTFYPGKNSLISEVIISINKKNQSDSVVISSDNSLVLKGFPVIINRLLYKNYTIQFKTLIRPQLKIKLKKSKNKILNEINLIKKNVLIIGASSGIGNDLLENFLNNKKIKIIGTYFKNKINKKRKNLIIKKINIETNLQLVFKLIKKHQPCLIYYFATPKILFKTIKDKKIIQSYNNYFIKFPIQIIKYAKRYNSNFFYPSTTYSNNLSLYFKIKSKAEREINKLKNEKIKISVVKLPGVNTKQSLSLIHKKLPNFRDLMSNDNEIFKKVFFKY